jgi:thioredoxin 1
MANFSELVKSHPLVLVDFSADWCGPCKMLAPILKEVKNQTGDAVRILKIDVDKNPEIAGSYQVQGVPTMILFKDGKQVWRQSGVMPAHELKKLIDGYQN